MVRPQCDAGLTRTWGRFSECCASSWESNGKEIAGLFEPEKPDVDAGVRLLGKATEKNQDLSEELAQEGI